MANIVRGGRKVLVTKIVGDNRQVLVIADKLL